jgi:PAS domain S-box-containing protein
VQTSPKEGQPFKAWIDAAPDGVLCADRHGKIVYGNAKICELLGYGPKELCKLAVADTYHPSEMHIAAARLDAAEIGVPSVCERRMRKKNGAFEWVEIRYARLASGGVVGMVREITARRQHERRLRAELALARLGTAHHAGPPSIADFLAALGENLDWDYLGCWRPESNGGLYRCESIWQRTPKSTEWFAKVSRGRVFRPGQGLVGRVAATTGPIWVTDITRDADFARVIPASRDGLRSACAIPLLAQKNVIAVLEFLSHELRDPDETALQTMVELGGQLAGLVATRAGLPRPETYPDKGGAEVSLKVGTGVTAPPPGLRL